MHPVKRISWRPGQGHETEIAVLSGSEGGTTLGGTESDTASITEGGTTDRSEESRLELWDVRRGNVAKYLLGRYGRAKQDLTGSMVDIAWDVDGQAIRSCYSGGAFVQDDVRNHHILLDNVPKQSIAWSARGETICAIDKFTPGEIPFDDL